MQNLFASNFYTTVYYTKQVVPNFHWNATLFPQKTAYFLNDRHGSYKNVDGNSKPYITKLIPFSKLTF